MSQLQSGNGFVNDQDFFFRMARFRPAKNDYYILQRLPGRLFSEVGIMVYSFYGGAVQPLFKVYTGTEDVYNDVKAMFHRVAEGLGEEAKSKEWK